MHTILVCQSRDNPILSRLEGLLLAQRGSTPPEVVTLDQAEARCRKGSPGLVVVLLQGSDQDRTLDTVRQIHNIRTGHLLVVGPATDPKLILRAMQAGADLFLDEADLGSELNAALSRLQARQPAAAGPGQLIAVLSASGGCGASTLAVNMAALLAKARGRCNLIDLNPGKADLAPLLDLKPQYTLADLCRNVDRLDRTLYEKLQTPHPSGVGLLAAPWQFHDICSITTGGVAHAIRLAREAFASVVVDIEDCFHEEQVTVLGQATTIFLVCRLDFTAVRNTRRVLDHLAAQGVPRERIEIVVNHSGLPNELPVEEAEVGVGGKLTMFVPHDPETICWANNTGIPAAIKNPESAVVQSIARLIGLDTPAPPRQTMLARIGAWLRDGPAARLQRYRNRSTGSIPVPTLELPPQLTKTRHEPIPEPRQLVPRSRPCPV
jgi:pilus assembly protein CpaE